MKKVNRSLIPMVTIGSLFLSLVFSAPSMSQSGITKRVNNNQYASHTIDNLVPLRPDQYNWAVYDQLGVIGNNFFGVQVLSEHINDNSFGTPTDYSTVASNKMTFCGKVLQQYFRDAKWYEKDDDLNLQIICNPKNPAFSEKYLQIKNRRRNVYPWATITGEIDIDPAFQRFFDPKNTNLKFPIVNSTDVCLYGPWIEEVYNSREDFNPNKDHVDVHEIHPAEQFWWVERTQAGFRYYLNAANDASGRFGASNWISGETQNTFAIAFDIKKRSKEKIVYQIVNVCNQGASAPTPDGKKHYLILGRDTLMQVEEPAGADIMSVSFKEVGSDPYALFENLTDTIVKGFVVLQSTIRNNGIAHGNLKLFVDKKRITTTRLRQLTSEAGRGLQGTKAGGSIFRKVAVTLKEITTLANGFPAFGPGSYNLTGYIYVEKGTENLSSSKSSAEILEDKPQLLFPLSPDTRNNRVISHNLFENGAAFIKSTYNKTVYITISANEKINIITDFEAAHVGSSISTLELIDQAPFYELQMSLSDLTKGIAVTKEIGLENRKGEHKYKMRIKIDFMLLE